ncbi:NAD(P)-dependent oxidoreductase [Nocardioides sp.]|uniref:NAD(P)-dependent oxidoreductase n=1 Tax=Nocardioides sp. TaxID=35761 RepID=UPI0019BFAB35|nr:NAD(P)-dependent oxidoreductase [Nocardioides sp.]MBC7278075.1 NAD(P)-dependent oxidoreductase [Nocardioides sp.]
MTVIAVLGLGEAGSLFVADLLTAGAMVRAYDPAIGAPPGAVPCASEAMAVDGADLVISVNSAADSVDAARSSLAGLSTATVWADVNTSSPARKREVAAALQGRCLFADVALMSTVPGLGIRVPMVASGPGATDAALLLGAVGATVDVIEGIVGDAATRKLLRSVFYKGLAAAVLESLAAAHAAGLEEETRAEIMRELERASATTLDRLVVGSHRHAVRRSHEMAAATEMLDDLGVPSRVARASRYWLEDIAEPRPKRDETRG